MKNLIKTFIGIIVLLPLLYSGCRSCNPKTGNFAFIGTWDVPPGETFAFDGLNDPASVDFIGRVFYASKDTLGDSLLNRAYPLIIYGHGRFSGPGSAFPNNYLASSYLMNHLASWGYIVVSVNFDVLHNASDAGISHRGQLFLHAIDYMLSKNNDPSSKFYQKIDVTKIALIGHSRGGGGATYAVNLNQSQGSPRNIKALATISPTSGHTNPISGNMPQLMLYGTWDGDLCDAQGYAMWDQAPRDRTKIFVEIHGANHFFFSDNLVYSNELNGIPRANHQSLAKGFINAFFDKFVNGLDRYEWPIYLTGNKRIDTVDYFIQYLNDTILVVDNGDPLGTPALNNLNGANSGTSLTLFDDRALNNPAEHQYGSTNGLRATWDNLNDSLLFNLPGSNAGTYKVLHFRIGQRYGEPENAVDNYKNFTVRLKDNSGHVASVILKNYHKGVHYPDLASYPPGSWCVSDAAKNFPVSFRIPLSDFAGIDLTQIAQIAFLFDQPNEPNYLNISGAITIDDIEFSN